MENIKFEDWKKLDLRIGKILKIEEIETADRLYKLKINLGDEERTIVAGLKKYYSKEELIGKKCVIFCNLEPRTIKGIESQGMILAAVDSHNIQILKPFEDIKTGSKIS